MGAQDTVFTRMDSAAAVAGAAAAHLSRAAARAIASHGRFRCVLAGGRTPLDAYRSLVDRDEDWVHWHLYLGDERCLAAEDPERNSRAIASALTDRIPIPAGNLHWIAAELGAQEAARRYERLLQDHLPFDLVLLGMGEDGHTASLFPGLAVASERWVAAVQGAPKPPPDRVTLTPMALAAAPERLILVTGGGKRDALAAWRRGDDLPVARIAALGPTRVLVDPDADGP